jgi:hypothetical protein
MPDALRSQPRAAVADHYGSIVLIEDGCPHEVLLT